VSVLTTLGGRVDVETVILQPRSNSEKVAHETWDSTVEDSGVAGKHVGVEHPRLIILDHNWKEKESLAVVALTYTDPLKPGG
jgi:hypothetical protein